MIQSHRLYEFYINYLDYKKRLNRFSDGAYAILKISESSFKDFSYDYDNNESFKKFINDIHISEIRDKKIKDILNRGNNTE